MLKHPQLAVGRAAKLAVADVDQLTSVAPDWESPTTPTPALSFEGIESPPNGGRANGSKKQGGIRSERSHRGRYGCGDHQHRTMRKPPRDVAVPKGLS
jgi:hypothetical protein